MAEGDPPFVIKKIRKIPHAHHGGSWKIAYADFMTAMMAFFLLMWLISMTTPEQKRGIADYFSPPNVSESTSGAGGVLGGTADDSQEAKLSGSNSNAQALTSPDSQRKSGPMVAVRGGDKERSGELEAQAAAITTASSSSVDVSSRFNQDFQGAAASIRQAWQAMPDITDLKDNLVVEQVKDGLIIKIMDQQGRPMFPPGSAQMYDATRKAVAAIAPVLQRLPNQIAIAGFTATGMTYPDPHRGPWELSMDRANAVRDTLGQYGLTDDRINSVSGRATNDPIFPDDPYMVANNRVEIKVLYQPPSVPPDMAP